MNISKIKINNEIFKYIVLKFLELIETVKSISFLKKGNSIQFDLRIRLMITLSFVLHALGIHNSKKLFLKYKQNKQELKYDIEENKLTFDLLIADMNKNKRNIFLKKIKAVLLLVKCWDRSYLTNYFEFFKIKNENRVFDELSYKSALVVLSKEDSQKKRLAIFGLPCDIYKINYIKTNKCFLNSSKTVMNTVFLPISLKYRSFSQEELNNFNKIDISFWNYKANKKSNNFAL
ncbi:hypothetical protein [Mycoplasmopsis felifaucium]|uniref:Uncharacterized protein n=1 Tax=Mycoplasmopsis felifaucium TaxID=35768 RepID=A0ABZ2RTT0_9BACT